MTEVVDAQVVEHTQELATVEQQHPTLFRTDDPVEVIEKATAVADALRGVLDQQGLTASISGKRHVLVEGWTTLGSMIGVFPVCVWTRKLEDGWEARVEARTLDGRTVGSAEAECLRTERMWKQRDDYALRSMAQTRATSKALRAPLGWIVTLAGYESTPAEEMPSDQAPGATDAPPPAARTARTASEPQQRLIRARAREAGLSSEQLSSVIRAAADSPPKTFETSEAADQHVDKLLSKLPWPLVDPILEAIKAQ